ncbi:MAG: hypothetical protein H7Y08_12645, partial [Rhizobiaceae bacterium]|nr:hypothetical protein [Rhizobiaceae bacterium]
MSNVSAEAKDLDVDIFRLVGAAWRRKLAVLLATFAFAGIAFAISSLVAPLYKADTRLVIESRESAYTSREAGRDAAEGTLSPDGVESQVSLLTSAEVLGNVAERFALEERDEFARAPSFLDELLSQIGAARGGGEGRRHRRRARASRSLPQGKSACSRGGVLFGRPRSCAGRVECDRRRIFRPSKGRAVGLQLQCHGLSRGGDRGSPRGRQDRGRPLGGFSCVVRPSHRPEPRRARDAAAFGTLADPRRACGGRGEGAEHTPRDRARSVA